jgi:outer membrane immunogenic protein
MMYLRNAAAAVMLLTSVVAPAFAADLPARMAVKAPVAVAPVFDWTGFYIGAHVGYGWSDHDVTMVTGSPTFPPGFVYPTSHPSGVIGGGQVGFNYQIQRWVLGIEGDGSAADMRGSVRAFSPLIAGRYSDLHTKFDWIATLAGRLGFAADNWLFYGKGGVAWAASGGSSETYNRAGAVLIATTSPSGTGTGWIVGAGTEYAFSNNWSAKLEYDYIDLGRRTTTTAVVNTPAFGGATNLTDFDRGNRIQMVKLGVNYRFNFGGPAVIAKY